MRLARRATGLRRLVIALTSATALALLPADAAEAAAGALDPSFRSGGCSTVSLGSWAGAAAGVVQPDGKIVTAGEADIGGTDVRRCRPTARS